MSGDYLGIDRFIQLIMGISGLWSSFDVGIKDGSMKRSSLRSLPDFHKAAGQPKGPCEPKSPKIGPYLYIIRPI